MVTALNLVIAGLDPVSTPVEWRISQDLVAYEDALATMDARAAAIAKGSAPELVWLLEHPSLYTAGTSAKSEELIAPRFPVHSAGRGGQLTYHGPGQRVAYLMLDLKRRGPDVRRFVATLEEWIIRALAHVGVVGERRQDRIGVWVRRPEKGRGHEDKIAAIGIRIKRWVTLHGVALNIDCDLSHYAGIVPCGVSEPAYGVTSLADLGRVVTVTEIDALALNRGQNRKPRAAAQRKLLLCSIALIDVVDARAQRSPATGAGQLRDGRRRPREYRLNVAVAPIADPASHPMIERGILHKSAVTDALYAAADDEVAHHAHPTSPVSLARAPRQRDGAQRASE